MPKAPKDLEPPHKPARSKVVRFTLLIPECAFQNLELHALTRGKKKQQIVINALLEYLRAEGMDPLATPRIDYSYPGK